jgi:hypothetical protein
MNDKRTQPTQPRKREGDKWVTNPDVDPVEIPVPSRRAVEDALKRVAKPSRPRKRRPKQ